ncbi:hypothetical protein LTR36_000301 [Oleoguttula mirabilis]|uniref:RBR-type E3 ubiquitin transferase n=1 Tax=Oleoguttula mirabilis TaxID=1507867 RepID=A0AAV9JYF0_9PEZI|nr:hypothetical protein LTR36_000301 [Oleoguttula mirabilis]
MAALYDERVEELGSLEAIYPELTSDLDRFTASLELAITPSKPLLVRFIPHVTAGGGSNATSYAAAATNGSAYVERDVKLSHLPPLCLQVTLPAEYPADAPPKVHLTTKHDWLPKERLSELEAEAEQLWEEYGHCQILFTYIDSLQQAAERGLDLDQSADGCLVLSAASESKLVSFDSDTTLSIFNTGTYDCGICLEPKKGSSCYRMKRCGHVFCLDCLQGFYNNAITEGDMAGIRCLDPTCGKTPATPESSRKRKRKAERTLHPRELLAMGIEESMVRRYVEMKRKKKLEADKSTVYCPRTWCQGAAKSSKYPPIPADLLAYAAAELSSGEESDVESTLDGNDSPRSTGSKDIPPDPADRLAVCEKCSLAFCRVCYMGWHGEFARCFPRDPNELSVEEKASYDYIRLHTSPCPTCCSPTQKTMGCNHMKCFQCNTHFCYLCGAWLDGQNPYQHFNKAGTQCFQRLWELEEGDEGQNPGDGQGFAGGRGWEQMAIDVARDADAQEAAAQAADREAHAEEDAIAAELLVHGHGLHMAGHDAPFVVHMAQIRLDEEPEPLAQHRAARGARRQRNPFQAHPPAQGHQAQAQAVRNHERAAARQGRLAGHGRVARRPATVANDEDERQQAELQRFLEMAQRDEEDGWDSDGLDEDDGVFEIR